MLAILRGAALDLEANDTFATAQVLPVGASVAGAITTSDDWYTVTLAAGETLQLATATPGGGTGAFVNTLDPLIEIYSPANAVVAADNNSAADGRNAALSFTAPAAGAYRVRVAAVGITTGEYLLLRTTAVAPTVNGPVVINGGAAQRSRVTTLTVNFNSAVTLASGAFTLTRVSLPNGQPGDNLTLTSAAGGGIIVTPGNGSTVTLTFDAVTGVDFGSLADGVWVLTIDRTKVSNGSGTMATDFVTPTTGAGRIARLFGDGDGNSSVTGADLVAFRNSFGTSVGDSAFRTDFDVNIDGSITGTDLVAFRNRFGVSV